MAEHKDNKLAASTLNTIAAASALGGGDVSVLVAGSTLDSVSKAVQGVTGVSKVLTADQPNLSHQLAEHLSQILVSLHSRSVNAALQVFEVSIASQNVSQAVQRQASVHSHTGTLKHLWAQPASTGSSPA